MKSQISKAEAEKEGQGQLGEASCAELLDTVLQTAVSLFKQRSVRITYMFYKGNCWQRARISWRGD